MSADARPFRRWMTGWEWERNSKHHTQYERESSSGRVSTYYIQILYKYIEDMRTRFGRERLQSSYSLARVKPTKRSNRHNKSRAAVEQQETVTGSFLFTRCVVSTVARTDPAITLCLIVIPCFFFFFCQWTVCVCAAKKTKYLKLFSFWDFQKSICLQRVAWHLVEKSRTWIVELDLFEFEWVLEILLYKMLSFQFVTPIIQCGPLPHWNSSCRTDPANKFPRIFI